MRRLLAAVAALLALAILGSTGFVAVLHAQKRRKVAACAGNLRTLWKGIHASISLRATRGPMPTLPGGKEFWGHLRGTTPPILDRDAAFVCPVRGDFVPGEVQYLGPAGPVTRIADGSPVGCDEAGNHRWGGGNVLVKSGSVVESSGALWERCMKGACVP